MVSQDADSVPDWQSREDKSRYFLRKFVVMEELAVAHAHTRNKRQFKQWLKKSTPSITKVKVFNFKKLPFSIAGG
jgi:hypothetical protein